MPVITQLHIYPVKSLQGISIEQAELTVRGLEYDRNWLVVDESGSFVTQRQLPELATIGVRISDDKLNFFASSDDTCAIPLRNWNRKAVTVKVWGDHCEAFDEGDEISDWLTEKLKRSIDDPLRLLKFNKSVRRNVDKAYLKEEDAHTAFADDFPFLVTSEESLNTLNDRLVNRGEKPVTMDRFRPNIVMKGCEPLQENNISHLSSIDGRYTLGIRKPCKRCKVTTVDQLTGQIAEPKEPLRTLTIMETIPGQQGAYFGQNSTLISGDGEKIKVGDMVEF